MNCSKFYVNGVTFYFSYEKLIMIKMRSQYPSKIYLNKQYYDFSRTTAGHRNYFLDVDNKEFKKRLAAGEYTIVNELESCIDIKFFNDKLNDSIING